MLFRSVRAHSAALRAAGLDFAGWTETQTRLAALRKAGIQVPPLERH